jgi:hypothetical protein
MSRSTCAGIREYSASTSCGAKQDGRSCASCPEFVGGAPAPGFAGDAGSADRSPGPGGERRSATRQNGASKTQPGVGESLGDVSCFARGQETASCLRLIPREHSSGGRQKLGVIMRAFATINFIESRVASRPGFLTSFSLRRSLPIRNTFSFVHRSCVIRG